MTKGTANMPRRVLITGVTGQDGHYLSEYLQDQGDEVFGLVRRCSRDTDGNGVPFGVHEIAGDICDNSVTAMIADLAPDEVYNLAAMTHVGDSFKSPSSTLETNVSGMLNVLEGARACGARFYQASSSEMFGNAFGDAYHEGTPFDPQSPYAVSKVAAHNLVNVYRNSYQMHASCGIAFNHESPLRGADFVTQKVCRAAAAIAAGLQDKLVLGNLNAYRDWGHAKDYVKAMVAMVRHDEPGDYVLATGETHSICELCEVAFEAAGLGDWKPYVITSRSLTRPSEVHRLLGYPEKALDVLGWEAEVSFKELITEMGEAARVGNVVSIRKAK
jgi:GDPmannose 4,6-dehydratase